MSIAILQTVTGVIDASESAGAVAVTFSATVTTGSLLLACVSSRDANPATHTITDNKTNTWVSIGSIYDGTGRGCAAWYAFANAGSVGTTPIVTITKGAVCGLGMSLFELSGVDTGTPVEAGGTTYATVSTGPAQVTLSATAFGNDQIWALLAIEATNWVTCTDNTNYTTLASLNATGIAMQQKVQNRAVSATAAYTPGWTINASSHIAMLGWAFKGTAGAAAGPSHFATLTGVGF